MAKLYHTTHDSPTGQLVLVASESGLRALYWQCESKIRLKLGETQEKPAHPLFSQVKRQLDAYFSGTLQHFDLPLDPIGTPFQLQAWQALRTIPYGQTLTYGQQAQRIGKPNASRAVGAANGRNPISIIVPCHRVIGQDGALTGFGGGLDVKKQLLALEKHYFLAMDSTASM